AHMIDEAPLTLVLGGLVQPVRPEVLGVSRDVVALGVVVVVALFDGDGLHERVDVRSDPAPAVHQLRPGVVTDAEGVGDLVHGGGHLHVRLIAAEAEPTIDVGLGRRHAGVVVDGDRLLEIGVAVVVLEGAVHGVGDALPSVGGPGIRAVQLVRDAAGERTAVLASVVTGAARAVRAPRAARVPAARAPRVSRRAAPTSDTMGETASSARRRTAAAGAVPAGRLGLPAAALLRRATCDDRSRGAEQTRARAE